MRLALLTLLLAATAASVWDLVRTAADHAEPPTPLESLAMPPWGGREYVRIRLGETGQPVTWVETKREEKRTYRTPWVFVPVVGAELALQIGADDVERLEDEVVGGYYGETVEQARAAFPALPARTLVVDDPPSLAISWALIALFAAMPLAMLLAFLRERRRREHVGESPLAHEPVTRTVTATWWTAAMGVVMSLAGTVGTVLLRLFREREIGDSWLLVGSFGVLFAGLGTYLAFEFAKRMDLLPGGLRGRATFTGSPVHIAWHEAEIVVAGSPSQYGWTIEIRARAEGGGPTASVALFGAETLFDTARALEREVSARRTPELLRRFDGGETLDLGAVQVSRDRVRVRRFWRWTEVPFESLTGLEDGPQVLALIAGTQTLKASRKKIRNAFVLDALVARLGVRAA